MKDKLVSFALSVLIAFGLWMYVITEVSPNSEQTYLDIPVKIEGETLLRERNLIITAMSSTVVDLTLSGNRTDLNELNSSNITLKADMTKIYDPGVHKIDYDISYPGNVAGNAFNRENQNPDSITVTVERLIRNKEIPVNIIYQGKAAEGYVVRRGDVVLDNTHILVTGPQSVVDQITQAVITVDLEGQTESISQNYRVTLCNSDGEGVDSELITVNIEEVHMDLTIHRKKQVELVVTVVPGGGATENDVELELSIDSIQISGSDSALEQVGDTINLGTIDLADPVDTGAQEQKQDKHRCAPSVKDVAAQGKDGIPPLLSGQKVCGKRKREEIEKEYMTAEYHIVLIVSCVFFLSVGFYRLPLSCSTHGLAMRRVLPCVISCAAVSPMRAKSVLIVVIPPASTSLSGVSSKLSRPMSSCGSQLRLCISLRIIARSRSLMAI